MAAPILLLLCAGHARAQGPTPGAYYCYTTQNAAGRVATETDRVQVMPAFFGGLVFQANGTYRFTRRPGGGRAALTPDRTGLTFTGDMRSMRGEGYSASEHAFTLTNGSIAFICTLEGARSTGTAPGTNGIPAQPTTTAPQPAGGRGVGARNEGTRGKLLVTESYAYNHFLGAVREFDLATGAFRRLFPDGAANQNPRGEIVHFDRSARVSITDRSGTRTLAQLIDKPQLQFDELYPAISHAGDFVALTGGYHTTTGGLADLVSDGVELVIMARDGRVVARHRYLTQAAWSPDGGIIAAGTGPKRGLYRIEPGFQTVRRIAPSVEDAAMPAVSPDGKSIAFVRNDEVWRVQQDGSGLVSVLTGGTASFPAWSPDGRFIAALSIVTPRFGVARSFVFIVNVSADTAFVPKDDQGRELESRNRLVWLP
ncbi:MAG: PD40 domain-containing protein [Gemmatimonadaceae bacterium]|nr:PD40 domain-containing protein [Gemmatimonadaceae bacterium]